MLTEKCVGCHGDKKQKGKFRLDDFASLMKPGESNEATVVPGKSGESSIIKRVALPVDDDDHMPPKAKPQLTEKEVALIKWWIDAGANAETKVKDAKIPAELLK